MALGENVYSEVRDSERQDLLRRVARRTYQSYLHGLTLVHLRAYRNATINFDFPVTALVGPNGGGKSTVLGAAALISKNIKPRQFFAKSGTYDSSMIDWKIEYDLMERGTALKRTASYPSAKWNREAVERLTLVFGIARTLPATERKDLTAFIGGSFKGFGETVLSSETIAAVETILGKEAEKYLLVSGTKNGDKELYAARTKGGDSYSEFHFGAGEASVIRIVSAIEDSADDTLILIEEIENGLHPVATRRLVEYLISVARRKSCQIIFTTHSNDALSPLPDEAVWACGDGKLTQGKLDVNTLRTLTGEVEATLAIFVEDSFGEEMALAALREYSRVTPGVEMVGVAIHYVAGAGRVKSVTIAHNENPAIAYKALGVLDGDKAHEADHTKYVVNFPGTSDPELHVVQSVVKLIDDIAPKLALNLNFKYGDADRVKEIVLNRLRTNRDPHVLFDQIGEDLEFTAGITVARAFLTQWAENYPQEVAAIFMPAADIIPNHPPMEHSEETTPGA
jgi:energy-coupling factor transporter ATP-binding protein EcfA2